MAVYTHPSDDKWIINCLSHLKKDNDERQYKTEAATFLLQSVSNKFEASLKNFATDLSCWKFFYYFHVEIKQEWLINIKAIRANFNLIDCQNMHSIAEEPEKKYAKWKKREEENFKRLRYQRLIICFILFLLAFFAGEWYTWKLAESQLFISFLIFFFWVYSENKISAARYNSHDRITNLINQQQKKRKVKAVAHTKKI